MNEKRGKEIKQEKIRAWHRKRANGGLKRWRGGEKGGGEERERESESERELPPATGAHVVLSRLSGLRSSVVDPASKALHALNSKRQKQ